MFNLAAKCNKASMPCLKTCNENSLTDLCSGNVRVNSKVLLYTCLQLGFTRVLLLLRHLCIIIKAYLSFHVHARQAKLNFQRLFV